MNGHARKALLSGAAGAVIASLLTIALIGGSVAGAQSTATGGSPQIIGGSMLVSPVQTSQGWEDYMGLFGYAQDVWRGSRLPVGGTITGFTGMTSTLPQTNGWYEFTLFCSAPREGASSCGGPGPDTLTCTIDGRDYHQLTPLEQSRATPYCVDGGKPKAATFAAGDWVNVRFRTDSKPTAVYAHWTATFTPTP